MTDNNCHLDYDLVRQVIEASPDRVCYGKVVEWYEIDGTVNRTAVNYVPTLEQAERGAYEMAIDAGWTPRRWWQWWRWREAVPPSWVHEAYDELHKAET